MNKKKVGLIFGSFLGLFHLVWVFFVVIGFAQPFLDFVFNIHLLYNPLLVAPFSFGRAIILIVYPPLPISVRTFSSHRTKTFWRAVPSLRQEYHFL